MCGSADSVTIFTDFPFAMQIHHDSRNLFLEGPAGRMEAILWTPTRAGVPSLAAVLCHPHPLFGCTLHNKVVFQAAKSLDALGIPVLRFNFRGAGLSAGEHDRGLGERGDVQAAIDFLPSEFPSASLLVGGFSFGSWVAMRVGCADPRVHELIGLGIPVNSSDFTYLESCVKPKLIVQGTRDEYGDWEKVESIVAHIAGDTRLSFVQDADHFFAGHLEQLNQAIITWVMERHPDLKQL
jgi:alpha/beta superfamily hydrolase